MSLNILRTQKARKEHKCCHCYLKIPKGVMYHYQVSNYDGFAYFKSHIECSEEYFKWNSDSYDDWYELDVCLNESDGSFEEWQDKIRKIYRITNDTTEAD